MKNTDIVISINVHEKPDYLNLQIENIKKNVILSNEIILNCNDFMAKSLKNIQDKKFAINPDVIEKRKYHGSLTLGIYSNIKYALDNYDFKYFLVMSSREFFYSKLEYYSQIEINKNSEKYSDYYDAGWHWPIFRNTKLFNFLKENNLFYSSSAHEGLCLTKKSCEHIVQFLENHSDIAEDIFNFNYCVEEFALQSICVNFDGFYCIGNGVYEKNLNTLEKNKLTYKRSR